MTNEERSAAHRILDTPDITYDGVTAQCVESSDAKLVAAALLRDHPADDDEAVTHKWLLSVGFFQISDHYECNLSADGFWKVIVDLEEPPDLSIQHKRDWLSAVKSNATRGDVRRLCRALGFETKATVTA